MNGWRHGRADRDATQRLDRGRSYLRSGSVVDLQIGAQRIVAKVSGSEICTVEIKIAVLAAPAWMALRKDVAGMTGLGAAERE